MIETIRVFLWGEEVGRLVWEKNQGRSYFTFNRDFLSRGLDIAPMVAPIGEIRGLLPIYSKTNPIYHNLPAFLADSLPDSWGNQLFEYWRTEKKIPLSSITPLDKLSFIGKRGLGAFEFVPDSSPRTPREKVNTKALIDLAQRIFAQREKAHILPAESLTLQSLIAVGTSAGGRQPKAIVAINKETGEIRSGQVTSLEGYDHFIMKFGDPQRSSAEIEMTYYEMAREAGICMMESQLIKVEGEKHFLTRRFDRRGNDKLHIQTLAAINPDADSYEKLLWTCRKMRLNERACEEVFRRMVFNIIANNTDDHNKNFSFLMTPNGEWSLAPAYDMTFIFNTGGFQPEERHCLMTRGKLTGVTREDVILFAHDNGIRKPEATIEKVAKAISTFRELATKNGVHQEWIERINTCISSHLADWGFGVVRQKENKQMDIDGHLVMEIHVEETYKGNILLSAMIDGKRRKHTIRHGTHECQQISSYGINNISYSEIKRLVRKYFFPSLLQ